MRGAGRAVRSASIPVVVCVRDRLEPLRELLDWLERAGSGPVTLVDNASTWPPLVEFLATTSHTVVRLDTNLGHRSPWLSGVVPRLGLRSPVLVTDPDVVPDDSCPLDAIDHLADLLVSLDADKVGLSLRIDDLPHRYRQRDAVRRWETAFWTEPHAESVFAAEVDTTFALHRPGPPRTHTRSFRTMPPYVARHLPWYADSGHPTPEEIYYRSHADPSVNSWDRDRLPEWLSRAIPEVGRAR